MWITPGTAPVVPSVQQDLQKLIDADDAAALSIVAAGVASVATKHGAREFGEEDGYDSPISTHDGGGGDSEEFLRAPKPSRRDASRPAWAVDSAQPIWAKARGSWAQRREVGPEQLASFTGSLIGGSFLPEDRGEPDCAPELLWHILADPQLVEGPPDAPLLSALRARQAQGFGQTVQQQLRLEFLVEWLRGEMLVERVQGHTPESSGASCEDGGRKSVEERLLTTFNRIVEMRRETVASVRRNFLRLQVAQQLVSRHCDECLQALKHCSEHATKLKCQAYLQTLWLPCGSKPQLELCILSPPTMTSSSVVQKGNRKKPRWPHFFGAEADGGRGRTPRRPRTAQIAQAEQQDGTQCFVEIFEVSQCRCHNVQSVGASLGLDHQRFEESVKHRTANGLRDMIARLQQQPLETVLHGDPMDPLDVGGAIATFLEMLAARLLSHCSPDRARSEVRASDASESDRARFLEALQVSDRGMQSIAAEFVFSHLHARIFPQAPTETDVRGSEWLTALEWIQPRHLDVPKELMDTAQVEQSMVTLRRLHKRRSPGDMLEALWRAFRNVTEAACLKAQMGPRRAERKDAAFGADDALPLFILVIIRANPPMLDSVMLYVDRFLTKEHGVTEQGYALTQVQLGVSFTASVRPDRLLALRPGEWERNMSRFQV